MDESEILKALQAHGEAMKRIADSNAALRTEVIELHQKFAARGPGGGGYGGDAGQGELAALIAKSDGLALFLKGNTTMFSVEVPARLLVKNTIINTVGSGQPLVPSDRAQDYIVAAPRRRLTIRGLFASVPTSSNLIERPAEATFTNSAGVQGGDASPVGSGEGSLKNESSMTFTLQQTAIVTIAHYISASRQILGDAPLLQRHLETRLLAGLNEEEENEMLTGNGAAGEMTGITSSATAFSGGATNQTRLDTLAKAANQLAVGNYEPSGFILHPTDWLNCQLEKTTTGEYVLGDPAAQRAPMLWGLPVVPTPAMTQGFFTCIDAAKFGYIADREDATVRISENVGDAFLRNLVHLLCERRCALVVELGGAAVYGAIATAG